MTQEETAKILTWAGVWKAEQECNGTIYSDATSSLVKCRNCSWLQDIDDYSTAPHGHYIPMPALEGDFADVVAMKCLRRLCETGRGIHIIPSGKLTIGGITTESFDDPVQAIFAAVLAYLEEQEK